MLQRVLFYIRTACLLILAVGIQVYAGQTAYICIPVADMVLKPLQSYSGASAEETAHLYTTLSASPEKGEYACLRAHQGLFNEQVTIVQERGDEVQVQLTNCFYDSPADPEPHTLFWLLKHALVTEEELQAQGVSQTIFPEPLEYTLPTSFTNPQVVTLKLPWRDPVTRTVYSAGTRFVRSIKNDTTQSYGIMLYNPKNEQQVTSAIPRTLGHVVYTGNPRKQQKDFVALLSLWATEQAQGVVPYVWGGISFTARTYAAYTLVKSTRYGQPVAYWLRPTLNPPYSGFDSSGLILRAAQIVGIPYPYKNTTTVMHHLRPLQQHDILEEGDIIWAPGHTIVISNLERNELIESQGYVRGYGKVHTLTLSQRYKNIATYDDLRAAYFNATPLSVLDSTGTVIAQVPQFMLLKFASVWDALN